VTTAGHRRPGTPPAAHSAADDPEVLVEAEEIEDLEAPAEAQQHLAGGQNSLGCAAPVKPAASLNGFGHC
jgi:hypothetical protein